MFDHIYGLVNGIFNLIEKLVDRYENASRFKATWES